MKIDDSEYQEKAGVQAEVRPRLRTRPEERGKGRESLQALVQVGRVKHSKGTSFFQGKDEKGLKIPVSDSRYI